MVAGTTPDEFETKLVREIASMPPGRSGYTTIKTIEETLRSKAGQLGGTRKEVPMRLQRLEAMGLFKRETRSRGTGSVETGELVVDHPLMANLIAGITPAAAPPPRLPRQPRPAPAPRAAVPIETSAEAVVETEAHGVAPEAEVVSAEPEPVEAPAAAEEAPPQREAPEPAPELAEATPFRWVTSVAEDKPEAPPATEVVEAKPPAKPRGARAPRKSQAKPRSSSRAKKPTATADSGSEATAAGGAEGAEPSSEDQPAENQTDQTVPV